MSENSILIVEESAVLSDLMRDLLEATGFDVVQASTSKDGLALLKEQTFRVVLVDADLPEISGLAIIEEMRTDAQLSSVPVLLVTSETPDPTSLPFGFSTKRCIHKPIDPVELISGVRAAGGKSEPLLNGSTPHALASAGPPPVVNTSSSATNAKVITVFSLKGGVGCSTIAVNLAVAIQQMWNEATALVDLSLEAGALNILLDIMPASTLDELVSENGNLTGERITQYMTAHRSGVSLLSAPPSPERAELIEGQSLRRAMSLMKEQFDYLVLDTASTFAEHTLMALEMADQIILPLIGDISSIRATTTALDIFQALSIPEDRVVIVFNELFPKMGLSRKHAETSMNLTMVPLPFGGSKVIDSVNLGSPLMLTSADNPFAQGIQALAEMVSGDHEGGVQQRARSNDLFSRVKSKLKA